MERMLKMIEGKWLLRKECLKNKTKWIKFNVSLIVYNIKSKGLYIFIGILQISISFISI